MCELLRVGVLTTVDVELVAREVKLAVKLRDQSSNTSGSVTVSYDDDGIRALVGDDLRFDPASRDGPTACG